MQAVPWKTCWNMHHRAFRRAKRRKEGKNTFEIRIIASLADKNTLAVAGEHTYSVIYALYGNWRTLWNTATYITYSMVGILPMLYLLSISILSIWQEKQQQLHKTNSSNARTIQHWNDDGGDNWIKRAVELNPCWCIWWAQGTGQTLTSESDAEDEERD